MDLIDGILDFIYQFQGRTPDQLSSLERQGIAVAAVAGLARLAPQASQSLVVNRFTSGAARYVSRHPFATAAAFAISESRNHSEGPGWAGSYTREIEGAILTPVFGQAPSVLQGAARGLRNVFQGHLTTEASQALNFASSVRLPRLPPAVINNPATRAVAGYLSRHPVALLASYFVANQIDRTFHPQLLGPFTQPAIMAGAFPLLAHYSPWIPSVIGGIGTAARYGAIGIAAPFDLFNKLVFNSGGRAAAAGQAAGPGRSLLGLFGTGVAKAFTGVPWAIRGSGAAFDYGARGLAGLYNLISSEKDIFFGLGAKARQYGASLRSLTAKLPSWAGTGRVAAAVGNWLAELQFLPAFPRTSRFLINLSWQLTLPLKLTWLYNKTIGLPAFLIPAYEALAYATFSGYAAPFTLNGRLSGAIPELKAWVQYGAWIARHPIQFAIHEIQMLSNLLRLPQLYRLGARAVPYLRTGLAGLRTGANFAGEFASTFFRLAGSNVTALGLAPYEIVNNLNDRLPAIEFEAQVLSAISGRLRSMRISEQQGYVFSRPVSEIASQIRETVDARGPLGSGDFLLRYLEFVSIQDELARRTLQVRGLESTIQLGATAIGALAWQTDQSLQGIQNRIANYQPPAPPRPSVQSMIRRNQPRDDRGRFLSTKFKFNTAQPLPGTGFNEVLAYINRKAAAMALQRVQSASTGVPIQPAIPGGNSGSAPPSRPRYFWLYRGRDRNLLLQSLRDVLEIGKRDELAASGKKTTQISNRDPIFSPASSGLPAALIQLIRALRYDVSLVRNRGPLGGYYALTDQELYEYLYSMWPNLAPFGATDVED